MQWENPLFHFQLCLCQLAMFVRSWHKCKKYTAKKCTCVCKHKEALVNTADIKLWLCNKQKSWILATIYMTQRKTRITRRQYNNVKIKWSYYSKIFTSQCVYIYGADAKLTAALNELSKICILEHFRNNLKSLHRLVNN